jgi:hypothetical protein
MTEPRKFGQRKYRVGAVWAVKRETNPFTFVVLGPALNKRVDYRNCSVEYRNSQDQRHNCIADYSIKHLRKYAICIKEGN